MEKGDMKNKLATTLLLSLCLSVLLIALSMRPVAALPTIMHIDPDPVDMTDVDYGTFFNVSVVIQDVTDLFGFDLNITWDNSLITSSHCYYNDTLNAVWGVDNWFAAMNVTGVTAGGTGWYKLVATSIVSGFTNDPGNDTLFDLEFQVQGPICNSVKETSIHFEVHKLSDSAWQSITHNTDDGKYTITGKTPTLQMDPASITARTYGEVFTIQVNITDAENVIDFVFEILYNATLLDHKSIAWDAWGSGTHDNSTDGILTGSTSGSAKSGTETLITLEFNATYYHLWKDEIQVAGWTNDLTGKIFFQAANLSYSGAPDLEYEKGTTFDINVDPVEVDYTFSPIRGDINNDGDVDIFDLRAVALYYDEVHDPYDLNGDGTIDIFDLVIIATNYGFEYSP
jgi:hypothetical protein